jgi:hypothetical protein
MLETTTYLLMGCNFFIAVWNLIAARFNLSFYSHLHVSQGLRACLSTPLRIGSKEKKQKLGVTFMVWCMIWKERNRRIFEERCLSAHQVATLVIEEALLQLATMSN